MTLCPPRPPGLFDPELYIYIYIYIYMYVSVTLCPLVHQASSIQNYGVTCESFTLGHNPFKLGLSQAAVHIPTSRKMFISGACGSYSFGVLFSSCACVCRCRGCCSLSVCVCVCVTCGSVDLKCNIRVSSSSPSRSSRSRRRRRGGRGEGGIVL